MFFSSSQSCTHWLNIPAYYSLMESDECYYFRKEGLLFLVLPTV